MLHLLQSSNKPVLKVGLGVQFRAAGTEPKYQVAIEPELEQETLNFENGLPAIRQQKHSDRLEIKIKKVSTDS